MLIAAKLMEFALRVEQCKITDTLERGIGGYRLQPQQYGKDQSYTVR
jgi:hypothetical protein